MYERVRERARELVNGLPAGAVRWQETGYAGGDERIDRGLDDRLEEAAGEVEAADSHSAYSGLIRPRG